MNRRQLHALCQQTMRQLGLTPPLDVELLRDRLGDLRGKPILLAPDTALARQRHFGFTVDDPGADATVIFYEPRTTWSHQILIILHELAHLICGHPGHAIDHSYRADHAHEFQEISPQTLAEVLSKSPPKRARRLTRRSGRPGIERSLYDQPAEWEAETMATIMIGWVPGCGGYITPSPADPLQAILGDVPAW